MAELTISSDEIRGALERYVSSYTPEISREEVGIVADASDGIAHVEGLPSTMTNELLEFADGTLGVALNLDVRDIGVVVLGDYAGIEEGQQVKRTGRVLSVPIGDAFLGRVVNPLGERVDDPTQERVADRHRQHPAGALDLHALLDTGVVPQDHDTDLADVEVEGHAQRAVLELQELVGHRRGQTLHVGDTVTRVGDGADLLAGDVGRV